MSISIATVRDPGSAEYVKGIALGESDWAKALPLWRSARVLDPSNRSLISHVALAHFHLENHLDVIRISTESFPRYPRLVHLANLYAASLCHEGHLESAQTLLEHVLKLDPDYPGAANSLKTVRSNIKQNRPAAEAIRTAIKEGLERSNQAPTPSLAVCMIVKNEEEFIEDAIQSVIDLADEVIVIDTGSTDRTVALSQAAGARVGFFEWTGDFSAARNVSLNMASSDWILVLDADERLSSASKTSVRAVMEEYSGDDDIRVFCVKIKNYTREGVFMNDGFSGRIFRNLPYMRFEGRVHEEVARGRSDISTDYRLDIVFEHYGADPQVMREKAKDDRNLSLLQQKLAEDPDDLITWFYVASQHWVAGRISEAVEGFDNVLTYYYRDPSRYDIGIQNIPVAYSYVGLIRGRLHLGDIDGAVDIGQRGMAFFPQNPDVLFHTGMALLTRTDETLARDCFQRAVDAQVTGYALISMNDKSIQEWRAQKMVADVDFMKGDLERAYQGYLACMDSIPVSFEEWHVIYARLLEAASSLEHFEDLPRWTLAYVGLRPSQVEVAFQVGRQLLNHGHLNEVMTLMDNLNTQVEGLGANPDFSRQVGQLAEDAGQDSTALSWYQKSAEAGNRDPRFWLNLANLFVRHNNQSAAQEAFKIAQSLLESSQG